jgi:hemerythrin
LFTRFKARVRKEGFRIEMLAELNQTLKTWIQDHILRVDLELKPCLARSGQ